MAGGQVNLRKRQIPFSRLHTHVGVTAGPTCKVSTRRGEVPPVGAGRRGLFLFFRDVGLFPLGLFCLHFLEAVRRNS